MPKTTPTIQVYGSGNSVTLKEYELFSKYFTNKDSKYNAIRKKLIKQLSELCGIPEATIEQYVPEVEIKYLKEFYYSIMTSESKLLNTKASMIVHYGPIFSPYVYLARLLRYNKAYCYTSFEREDSNLLFSINACLHPLAESCCYGKDNDKAIRNLIINRTKLLILDLPPANERFSQRLYVNINNFYIRGMNRESNINPISAYIYDVNGFIPNYRPNLNDTKWAKVYGRNHENKSIRENQIQDDYPAGYGL